jgi:cell division protein FtsB
MLFYSGGAFKASSIKESVWIAAGAMRIGRYLVLIILFVGFFIVFGNRGLLDNQRLKEKLAELRAETSRLEAADNGLKREVVLLRDDLRYIEAVARNELGMLKRGDLIYRFMDSAGKKDEAATPPPSNGGGQPSLELDEDKPRKDAAPYPAKRNPA